jgi:hypothetical protein
MKAEKQPNVEDLIRAYIESLEVVVPGAADMDLQTLKAAKHVCRCIEYGKMINALIPLPSEYGPFTPPQVAQSWLRAAESAKDDIEKQNPGCPVRLFWAGAGRARVEVVHVESWETEI